MRYTLTSLCLLFSLYLIGQPCSGTTISDEPQPCFACGSALIGSNRDATIDAFNFFFCATVENSVWVKTKADGDGNIMATILSSNCQFNLGLELGLYDLDFDVLDCFVTEGAMVGSVEATNLIPNGEYYILIDGFAGDVCDFSIVISGGTSSALEVPVPMSASPNTTLCPGAEATYSIPGVVGTTDYEWTIPANMSIVAGGAALDTFITLKADVPGGGVVRVAPNNECFDGIPEIQPIVVIPVVPAFLPPMFLCENELPFIYEGQSYGTYGSHEYVHTTTLGCDSIVKFTLIPRITDFHINCSETSSSIDFSWDSLSVDAYIVTINGIVDTVDFSWTQIPYDGSDRIVTITVEPIGGGTCIYPPQTETCTFGTSSLFDKTVFENIEIYPNPTTGEVNLRTDLNIDRIEIFDIAGKLFLSEITKSFNLLNANSGIYLFKVYTSEGVKVGKLLKH